MHNRLTVLIIFLGLAALSNAQPFTWTEDFGIDETCGILPADGFTSSNGEWTVELTGSNGPESHEWYVSPREAGLSDGECSNSCLLDPNLDQRTLYIAGESFSDIGGAAFENNANSETDLRIVSPVIDMSAVDFELSLLLTYIFGDHPSSSCTVQYYDGSTWSDLGNLEPTAGDCLSSVEWVTTNLTFPPSAQNNPNVRIGFHWVNSGTDYMTFPELSFAVSEIECICSVLEDVEDVEELFQFPTVSISDVSAGPNNNCSFCVYESWEPIESVELFDSEGNSIDNIEFADCTFSIPGWANIDDSENLYYSVSGCGSEIFEGLLESDQSYQYDPIIYYNGGFELEEDTLCGPGCVGFTYENGFDFLGGDNAEMWLVVEIEVTGGEIENLNEQPWGDTSGEICLVEPGVYTVTGFSYLCGYSSNYEADIVVVDCGEPPTAAFSVSDTLICTGDCINFTDQSTGNDIDTWLWMFEGPDTLISSNQNPANVCFDSTGTYTISLEVGNLTGSDDTSMVDIITVEECPVPISDLVISNPKYGSYDPAIDSTWRNLEYSHYEECQVRPLDLSASAINVGTVDQTNVYLEVTITDQWDFSETLTSPATDIAVGDSAIFEINDYLPPNAQGQYDLYYVIHQDQDDVTPDNNTGFRDFGVNDLQAFVYTGNSTGYTGYQFARDNGQAIASSENDIGGGYMVGMGFHMTAPAELCCIGAAIMEGSSYGQDFRFYLLDKNLEYLDETQGSTIWEDLIYDSTSMNFVWQHLWAGPWTISGDTDYIVAINTLSSKPTPPGAVKVGISDWSAPDSSSFRIGAFFDGNQVVSSVNATYMIRLGLSNSFCTTAVAEIADHVNGLKCVPNPSTGDVTVKFDLLKQSEIELFLFDNLGRVIHEQDFGEQPTGSYSYDYHWSGLSAGVYTLSIVSEDKAMTQKLVIE